MMVDEVANERYYYYYDGLGSVAALSKLNPDASVSLVEQYRYDVFGNTKVLYGNGTEKTDPATFLGNPTMFTGRRYDAESGLYYYRARIYNPKLGRFMQTDPIGYYDSMNLYQYCGNNPVNWIDPFGEEFFFLGVQETTYPLGPWWQILGETATKIGETATKVIPDTYPASLEGVPAPPIAAPTTETSGEKGCLRKGGGKNDKHGKSENLPRQEKQLKEIEEQLSKQLPRRLRRQLEAKRDNIKKDMARRKKGENHSQKPKGSGGGGSKSTPGTIRPSYDDWNRGYIRRSDGHRIPLA